MQRVLVYLVVVGAAVLGAVVLLPILGFLLVLLATAAAFLMAAPLLARLPWFRDWIRVQHHGGRRTVRFGRGIFMGYRGPAEPRSWNPHGELPDGDDVIDVVPRIIPDEDDDEEEQKPTK